MFSFSTNNQAVAHAEGYISCRALIRHVCLSMPTNITVAAGQKEALASISRSVMVSSAAGMWGSVGAKGRAAEGTDLEGKETGASIVKSCRRS